MANTQGMPDEFVESLMTTTTSSSTSAAERQRRRLQERIEMPLPQGGPAARIVRPSPQYLRQGTAPEYSTTAENDDLESPQPARPSAATDEPIQERFPTPMLGNVLERTPTTTSKTSRVKSGARTSRFAQQQRSMNGFPSVHVPLGTFCQPKTSSFSKKTQNPRATESVATSKSTSTPTTITNESLIEASKRDAQGMLEGLTAEEIRQEQQELSQALSPEIIAFLRKRRNGTKKQIVKPNAKDTTTTNNVAFKKKMSQRNVVPKRQTQQEKEGLAQLFSQVKTHQDLDEAYRTIMKEAHPLEALEQEGEKDDFAIACDLLRSTNSRQILWAARIVQRQLADYVKQQWNGDKVSRDWPLVLPVSLRCLLDETVQANSGYILHTFVLQSLYSLLQLNAHPDHVVHVLPDDRTRTCAEIFSDCFMDDAIPTPRLDSAYSAIPAKPLEATETDGKKTSATGTPAAYATQSSSSSAQSDGQAFDRDPMWTLLSKMRMVPRIAELMVATKMSDYEWPPEAWISFIGILSMMAQRSPGAASAIAHHESVLPRLVALISSYVRKQVTTDDTPSLAIVHAAFRFFHVLARQSRVTAQAIPLGELLPPLLSREATSDIEFSVQKLGLQLWRSVLRYGLGLEAVETMSTSAARHLALPYTNKCSLSTDFVSALSQVLELAKIAKLKKGEVAKLFETNPATLEILSMAGAYLAATRRSVMLEATTNAQTTEELAHFRWNAARMRFLTNYWNLSSLPTDDDGEVKTEEWSMDQVLTILEAMDEWTETGGLVESAWAHITKAKTFSNCTEHSTAWPLQAAAGAFLDSFVSLLLSISTASSTSGNRMIQEFSTAVSVHFLEKVLSVSKQSIEGDDRLAVADDTPYPLSQQGWVNRSYFVVAKVVSHVYSIQDGTTAIDLQKTRSMVFHLLGRLQCGDESMAAILFSQDFFFQAQSTPGARNPAGNISSPISSMFLGELCGSDQARKQLDHSFKLQHGFGVTVEGLGCFALDSLLSEADKASAEASTDLNFPIGDLWLWQCLSGQVRAREERTVAEGIDEATRVIVTVLGLIMDLETSESLNTELAYASAIPLGAKLYYFLNICLHTESVLSNDSALGLADSILEIYMTKLSSRSQSTQFILEFASACLKHTDPRKANDDDLEEKERKLLDFFNPDIPNEVSLTKEEMQYIEAFLDDMVEAYTDYGAQYDFFTKCMRIFLLPLFPVSIRCRALRELRGVLHLLTLPSEAQVPNELSTLLHVSISGEIVGSARDPPELLDAITAAATPNIGPRPLSGYMLSCVVCILARNVAISIQSEEGLEPMKRRLGQLDGRVCKAVFLCLNDFDGEKVDDLVRSTLNLVAIEESNSLDFVPPLESKVLEDTLTSLQQRLFRPGAN